MSAEGGSKKQETSKRDLSGENHGKKERGGKGTPTGPNQKKLFLLTKPDFRQRIARNLMLWKKGGGDTPKKPACMDYLLRKGEGLHALEETE